MSAVDDLTESFARLPGIGKKSATRLVNYILKADTAYVARFADELATIRRKVHPCSVCGMWCESDPCGICSDATRDRTVLCVVEQPQDAAIIESSREFRGLYHVLGGVISPLAGLTPGKLRISELVQRVREGGVREVIIATNPTVEGDTTALYIQHALEGTGVTVTQLASGLPAGGDLEYTDRLTLARSFRGRVRM